MRIVRIRDILRDVRPEQLSLNEDEMEELLERKACERFGDNDDWTWAKDEDLGVELYEERLRRGLVYIPRKRVG